MRIVMPIPSTAGLLWGLGPTVRGLWIQTLAEILDLPTAEVDR